MSDDEEWQEKSQCFRVMVLPGECNGRSEQLFLQKMSRDMTLRSITGQRKFWYFGNVRHSRLERDIVRGRPEGQRGRGSPPTGRTDDIKVVMGDTIVE